MEKERDDELHLAEETKDTNFEVTDVSERKNENTEDAEPEDFIQIRTETYAKHDHKEYKEAAEDKKEAESKDEEKEKKSSKTFFIALGIFALILLAIFLIPHFFNKEPLTLSEAHQENLKEGKDTDMQYVYNGYSFVYYDGLWYTQIYNQLSNDTYNVPLHFGPKNLTDIVIAGDLNAFFGTVSTSNISNGTMRYYLTFDPNDTNMGYIALANGELSQNLVKTFNIAPVSACTAADDQCASVPVVTCNTTDQPVVY
ncbi:hypothetical protein HZA99_01550, partial [Candidatus Woesearchaeota archaeon]|nr:hypothetical protein [Candidatus Woesearchaeota archaeon]